MWGSCPEERNHLEPSRTDISGHEAWETRTPESGTHQELQNILVCREYRAQPMAPTRPDPDGGQMSGVESGVDLGFLMPHCKECAQSLNFPQAAVSATNTVLGGPVPAQPFFTWRARPAPLPHQHPSVGGTAALPSQLPRLRDNQQAAGWLPSTCSPLLRRKASCLGSRPRKSFSMALASWEPPGRRMQLR